MTYVIHELLTCVKPPPPLVGLALRVCVGFVSFLLFEFYRLKKLNWASYWPIASLSGSGAVVSVFRQEVVCLREFVSATITSLCTVVALFLLF